MRHTKHLWRAGLILVSIMVISVLARSALQPETYGQYGSYRGADLITQRNKSAVHGAPGSCAVCHSDEATAHGGGAHKTVTCESCHAPLAAHVRDGEAYEKMAVDRDISLCLRCHRKLDARPQGFPQIELNDHLQAMGMELSPEICFACHLPHQPAEGL